VIPLFYKTTILETFDKVDFQTPFRKLDGGDIYDSTSFPKLFTKALLPCLRLFSTSPWHDHY
jgi:hypothetical protein